MVKEIVRKYRFVVLFVAPIAVSGCASTDIDARSIEIDGPNSDLVRPISASAVPGRLIAIGDPDSCLERKPF